MTNRGVETPRVRPKTERALQQLQEREAEESRERAAAEAEVARIRAESEAAAVGDLVQHTCGRPTRKRLPSIFQRTSARRYVIMPGRCECRIRRLWNVGSGCSSGRSLSTSLGRWMVKARSLRRA